MIVRFSVLVALLFASTASASTHDILPSSGFRNERMARLLVLMSLLGTSDRGSLADVDRDNGFRDARFGAATGSFSDLVRVGSSDGRLVYTRGSDSMRIGAAQIDRIAYGFDDGGLREVVIETSTGTANSEALFEVLQSRYGPGRRQDRAGDHYVWDARHVLVSYQDRPQHAQLVIRSKRPAGARSEAWPSEVSSKRPAGARSEAWPSEERLAIAGR